MKKYFIALLLLFTLFSCRKDNRYDAFIDAPKVNNAFTLGMWQVHFEKNVPAGSNYNGYRFEFNQNNMVTVFDESKKYFGKWLVICNDMTDDEPCHTIGFRLMFNTGTPYKIALLNGSFTIIQHTATRLELLADGARQDKIIFERDE
ncbi:MAG: hypothetical protein V4581_10725 [Bacteroidota bacterium]